MSESTTILSLVETDGGIEVQMSEKAYDNFTVIGLLEKIKMDLLNRPNPTVQDLRAIQKMDGPSNYEA
tara:strand:+ start:1275 stop:1478 length:204 start_codon:yes stop_codon:yes gene_type:complete